MAPTPKAESKVTTGVGTEVPETPETERKSAAERSTGSMSRAIRTIFLFAIGATPRILDWVSSKGIAIGYQIMTLVTEDARPSAPY